MIPISWRLHRLQLDKLIPHPKNPRRLTKEQHAQLTVSLSKYGAIEKPVVNFDGTLIGGHQRVKILKELHHVTVECWVPDRLLTQLEVDELNIRLNKNTGEWDWDILANEWDVNDLHEWGFSEKDLQCFEDKLTIERDDIKEKVCPHCGETL